MKKKTYEYELPRDENKLMADAIALACVDVLKDGPNDMSKEVVKEKARRVCTQLKYSSSVANNFDLFFENVVSTYTLMYTTKQKHYREDRNVYKNDVETMLALGGYGPYYDFIRGIARDGVIKAGGQV